MAEPLTAWVCATCGVQYSPSEKPPDRCIICEDERQYVSSEGQRWTTIRAMQDDGYRNTLQHLERDLVSIQTEPEFAIGQHALLVRSPKGNMLWDCLAYIDEETIDVVNKLGGISAIAMSHPHFYGSCVEWAKAFGAGIHLPTVDSAFVQRRDPSIRHFDEETIEPVPGLSVVRVGGHFHGSAVLVWRDGANGRGVLLTGDSVAVAADRRSVAIMYSYPNRIPLSAAEVQDVADHALSLRFDRLYAGWRGDVIPSGAQAAIRHSVDRYVGMLEGTWSRH
jgi:hypothetical protein